MQSKKEPMHWAPKLLIAFFVVLTLFMAAFVSIATNGLPDSVAQLIMPNAHNQATHTRFPGAVPHDRNHLYEPHLQRLEQQRNLGWQVELKGFEAIKEDTSVPVQITVKDKQGAPIEGATVTLDLWRMANSADDRKIEMMAKSAGTYSTELNLGDAGNWIVEIYIERRQDSYLVQQPLTVVE